jgi:hypothetical protein
MTNCKVHFSSPLEIPETQMTATAGKSSTDAEYHTALARWWGDFVPMDQWTPPKVALRFKNFKFRSKFIALQQNVHL